MTDKVILLVEDNPGDGVEALDYLFARGTYAGRDPKALPAIRQLGLYWRVINETPPVGGRGRS